VSYTIVKTDGDGRPTDVERECIAAMGGLLEEHDCRTPDQVRAVSAEADALLVLVAPITADVIRDMTKCRVIARYGIGVDNVDVTAAAQAGIWVTNVPDFCVEEASDHTLALVLALSRRLLTLDKSVRSGTWNTGIVAGNPPSVLRGKVLGLVGFGSIARLVAKKASALGMSVKAFDPHLPEETFVEVARASLEEIVGTADVLSLHLPLNDETRHIISGPLFSIMKPGVLIINTARGGVLREADLVSAMNQDIVGGFATDVMELEPPDLSNPLLQFDNTIFTPHLAWCSPESMDYVAHQVCENVAAALRGERPQNAVADIE